MHKGALAALATLVVGFSLFGLVPASASEDLEVVLQMPGETSLTNAQGQPVWVAGVWHDLSLSLEAPIEETLAIEASAIGVSGGGMGSHYKWERDQQTDTWSDLLYGLFIRPELSRATGDEIVFHLGIDAAAVPGAWSIIVTQDGALVGDQSIEVRTPRMAYGVSSADFNLRGEPFTGVELFSEDRNQYLRIINNGNVPLRLSVTFDRLQSRLRVVNPSDVVHVHSETKYFLSANVDPRPPQIVEVNGIARVEVSQALMTIPGIGVLTATALVSFVGDVRRFRSGRQLAAYLGLTPREFSSGTKRRLGRITKRGNSYVRMLLIHGARSALRAGKLSDEPDDLRSWALDIERRKGFNVAAVALANKLARVAWRVWRDQRPFERRLAA